MNIAVPLASTTDHPATSSVSPATAAASLPAVVAMRAVLHTRYGTPDVLTHGEVARPVPGPGEVLVRVAAAGVSIGDHHIITGLPYIIRMTPFGGMPRPRHRVPGQAMSGRVEAVGPGVTTLKVGDEVCGETQRGAYAELVVVAASALVTAPSNLPLEDAAALPWAVAALQALRDAGRLQAGQRVLVNGASGGVGSWAVQIAKAFGAEVTAVCSTRNVERMRALGADHVIDYTQEDFVAGATRYDLVFDTVGNRSVSELRRTLTPTGRYVTCSGGDSTFGWLRRNAVVAVTSWFSRRTLQAFVVKPNQADLLVIRDMVAAGKLRPSIERRFPLTAIADALEHVGAGRSQGQTLVTVGSSSPGA